MSKETPKIQRTFIIGDEWLYLKIYTGFKTSETIIKDAIYPIVEYFLHEYLIDKWFFIRYNDPKYHIRIRFHLVNKNKITKLILKLNYALKQYVEEDLIWKIQTDTYIREIERYGKNSIELSEEIFFIDSMAAFALIKNLYSAENENIRWICSMKMIDVLLDDFGYNLQQKSDLLQIMYERFSNEFNLIKDPRKQLGKKYRIFKPEIELMMRNNMKNEYDILINQKSEKLKPIIKQILFLKDNNCLGVDLSDLIISYIHMMLNRNFRTNHRKHELVIYSFQYNYYKSLVARQI